MINLRGLPWIIAAIALILLILLGVLFVFAASGFGRDTVLLYVSMNPIIRLFLEMCIRRKVEQKR